MYNTSLKFAGLYVYKHIISSESVMIESVEHDACKTKTWAERYFGR